MWIYILIFLLIAYLAKTSSKREQQKYFLWSMIFLAIFVGVSDMLGGYDRYIYCNLFDEIANIIDGKKNMSMSSLFAMYKTEIGYCLWNVLVAQITSNRYIYIFLTTILMYFLFYRVLNRYTEYPMIALVIFMALTFFFSFTYLRQMLATAFAWQALRFIEKKNLKMFLLWVGIAISFHNSAVIFLPVYFIPVKKISLGWITIAFLICMLIGISDIASFLFDLYASYDVERVVHSGYDIEQGFRWEYLAEALLFFFFISKYYYGIDSKVTSILGLYMSVIFCCILLIFIRSENGGRLAWFYMIGLYSLFSSIYSNKSLRLNPMIIFVICFGLYFRILTSWGVYLFPYKTFFTSGIRKGDYIERKYEYDHKYDTNKFYR